MAPACNPALQSFCCMLCTQRIPTTRVNEIHDAWPLYSIITFSMVFTLTSTLLYTHYSLFQRVEISYRIYSMYSKGFTVLEWGRRGGGRVLRSGTAGRWESAEERDGGEVGEC